MTPEMDIMLVAALTAVACAVPGTFLVLRRMSLIGDAVSHAVLPGIVIAVLLVGRLNSPWVVVGAGLTGMFTAALIEALFRSRRIAQDASIGVVFPALFALGVFLATRFTSGAHVDTDCVLYGEIALVFLDKVEFLGVDLPRSAWILSAVCAVNIGFVAVCWKELKIGTFDAELAAAAGLSPVLVQYLLMGSVSVTTTAAFESVGAILVVAMLVVPAATAYLLTDRVDRMLMLAVGFGVGAAIGGYGLARLLNCEISGAMATAAGAIFVPVWLFAPQYGLLAGWMRRRRLSGEYAAELVLVHLRRCGASSAPAEIAGRLRWSPESVNAALSELSRRSLVTVQADGRVRPAGAALDSTTEVR